VGNPYPDTEIVDWVVNSPSGSMKFHANGTSYLVVKKPIEGTNWVSIAMVNEGEVVKNLYHVRTLFLVMVVLLFLLGAVALVGFDSSFIKKVIELTEQTRNLEKGDFSASVQVSSQDEIGKLGMRFNRMVVTIQNYINREYKLKIKQRESELKALQSQIDPHFLYNTLDMIRWTARLENAMETGQLIERLSKIFRMNLNSGKMWVELEEEMAYIQNYLELQKSRLGNRLNYRIFYDDQIKHVNVMKQMLQPLVENSILHGFKNLPKPGTITVRVYKAEEEVWMDIIDNGWGFSNENHGNKREGYALKNLKERLEIAFGEAAVMERIACDTGAWIRLKLPLMDNEQLNLISNESGEQHDL
jgi:two-component system sensor histidine kinase YesM